MYPVYHDIFCLKPSEIFDVEGSFPCVNFNDLNITFSDSKTVTNLNDAFISYTLQRLCHYDANYNKNIVLLDKCLPPHHPKWKSLEFSCAVTISHLLKEWKRPVQNKTKVDIQVFDLVHLI